MLSEELFEKSNLQEDIEQAFVLIKQLINSNVYVTISAWPISK
jgi:hypothetical protein